MFGVKECSNLLQYLKMILERHQKKITQNNKMTTRQIREVCSVNMIKYKYQITAKLQYPEENKNNKCIHRRYIQ